MRNPVLRLLITLAITISIWNTSKGNDSLKYNISLNYYLDLSDTYGGGSLFAGEFSIQNSWYGASISYGHFLSHSIFNYSINIEELNKTIYIPFDELTTMQTASLSIKVIPIKTKIISSDLLFGLSYGYAKNSRFESVDYSYSLESNKFNYLYKDYKLFIKNHFGYQVGFNISFFITKKFGLQLNSRIQDLSNGGTFFFIGSGIVFRL